MSSCGLIMLDKFRGMDLCDDPFDFVFFFSVNEVRRWSGEVWAMRSCFIIGG